MTVVACSPAEASLEEGGRSLLDLPTDTTLDAGRLITGIAVPRPALATRGAPAAKDDYLGAGRGAAAGAGAAPSAGGLQRP